MFASRSRVGSGFSRWGLSTNAQRNRRLTPRWGLADVGARSHQGFHHRLALSLVSRLAQRLIREISAQTHGSASSTPKVALRIRSEAGVSRAHSFLGRARRRLACWGLVCRRLVCPGSAKNAGAQYSSWPLPV